MLLESSSVSPTTISKTTAFRFICGNDDFLVNREGQALFEKLSAEAQDPFSCEVIEGNAQNTGQVNTIVARVDQAIQTLSLFGEKKVVWLKGMNFIADSVTGRSERSKEAVDRLIHTLQHANLENTSLLITASPIDRRTKQFKALQKIGEYLYLDAEASLETLAQLAKKEAESFDLQFEPEALTLLLAKIGQNSRLLLEEVRKLATYIGGSGKKIPEHLVQELVPQFEEGDFFEFTEAFFSMNLNWTLTALERHFFANKEARSLLASLQNRNRLLLQLKALVLAEAIQLTSRGIDKASLERAASEYALPLADAKNKCTFNLFSQNPWYLARLTKEIEHISLRKLMNIQKACLQAFKDILAYSTSQESVMRDLVLKTLLPSL